MRDLVAHHRRGGGHITLGKPEQRKPRLRRPGAFVRFAKGLLGTGQITSPEPDVAEFHQRPAELAAQPRAQLGARRERFRLSLIKRT